MNLHTLTVVGVGLIGGSVGLAAKRRGLAQRVVGVGWRQSTLDQARNLGAIDEGCLDLRAAVRDADLVVLCTPVDRIAEQALDAATACKPGAVLTDAGSTKGAIVRAVETALPDGVSFVGSHPLAGSEKRGPASANPDLFQGRVTVVTRTPHTRPDAFDRVCRFWQALGSRVRVMDPDAHDRALALTSHLPHLLATALAGTLPAELHDLTATGFRDTTRVAAGDPGLWAGIFTQNQAAVLDGLGRLEARLADFRRALDAGDAAALIDLLDQGKKVRDALGS
jgi:prephenate dehydrogenase